MVTRTSRTGGTSVIFVCLLLVSLVLGGCVAGGRPLLSVELEREEVPLDGALVFRIGFVNTDEDRFVIDPSDECLSYQVVVLGPDGQFMERVHAAGDLCAGEVVVESGEALMETEVRLPLARHALVDGPFFKPGVAYRVQVGVRGETSWEVQTERTFRAVAPAAMPHLEVTPENEPVVIGEETTFHVRFTNGREVPFTFTSSDGCPISVYVELPPGTGTSGDDGRSRVEFWLEDGPAFCTQVTTEVKVDPGQTISGQVRWDGTTAWEDGEPVPPGTYEVHAVWEGWGHAWDANGTTMVTVVDAPTDVDDSGGSGDSGDRGGDGDGSDGNGTDEGARPRIRIETPSSSWGAEQTIAIRAWFHNTADVTFRLTTPDSCRDIHVYAVNEQGSRQPLWPADEEGACAGVFSDHEVRPGENLSTTVVWDPERMGPGDYTIQASFEATSASWETDAQTRVRVE